MAQPFNVQPPGSVSPPVASVDASGNEIVTGTLTVGGGILLQPLASAPIPVPGALVLYTLDGISLAYVGTGGQASGQTIPGNLTVSGNLAVTGTTALTGRETISGSDVNTLLSVVNASTNTGSGSLSLSENASTSRSIGVRVTGDAVGRYLVDAAGNTSWGNGSSTRDVTVGRAGAKQFYVNTTLIAGSAAALGDNGVGEIQLANATTIPTTNPTGGLDIYANAGQMSTRNPQGLVQIPGGLVQAQNAPNTVANTAVLTALQTFTVPANDPAAGTVYQLTGYGVYSDTGTPTLTFTLQWAGTTIAVTPAVTLPANITNAPFTYTAVVNFSSTTSTFAVINLTVDQSVTTDLANSYVATPTAATTVVSSGASALTMAVTWSAASASNTITINGGYVERLA
jgi:hypothetical protein